MQSMMHCNIARMDRVSILNTKPKPRFKPIFQEITS
jgi:hypothetical protein